MKNSLICLLFLSICLISFVTNQNSRVKRSIIGSKLRDKIDKIKENREDAKDTSAEDRVLNLMSKMGMPGHEQEPEKVTEKEVEETPEKKGKLRLLNKVKAGIEKRKVAKEEKTTKPKETEEKGEENNEEKANDTKDKSKAKPDKKLKLKNLSLLKEKAKRIKNKIEMKDSVKEFNTEEAQVVES